MTTPPAFKLPPKIADRLPETVKCSGCQGRIATHLVVDWSPSDECFGRHGLYAVCRHCSPLCPTCYEELDEGWRPHEDREGHLYVLEPGYAGRWILPGAELMREIADVILAGTCAMRIQTEHATMLTERLADAESRHRSVDEAAVEQALALAENMWDRRDIDWAASGEHLVFVEPVVPIAQAIDEVMRGTPEANAAIEADREAERAMAAAQVDFELDADDEPDYILHAIRALIAAASGEDSEMSVDDLRLLLLDVYSLAASGPDLERPLDWSDQPLSNLEHAPCTDCGGLLRYDKPTESWGHADGRSCFLHSPHEDPKLRTLDDSPWVTPELLREVAIRLERTENPDASPDDVPQVRVEYVQQWWANDVEGGSHDWDRYGEKYVDLILAGFRREHRSMSEPVKCMRCGAGPFWTDDEGGQVVRSCHECDPKVAHVDLTTCSCANPLPREGGVCLTCSKLIAEAKS